MSNGDASSGTSPPNLLATGSSFALRGESSNTGEGFGGGVRVRVRVTESNDEVLQEAHEAMCVGRCASEGTRGYVRRKA